MNFLAPWFLLGGLAIAGPVLFHLIRRAVRQRTPFSSLMFLRPTQPRITRRRKLEHLWLLVLRCLCLILLAIGFARPFLARDTVPDISAREGRLVVLLVDTSASMRRQGVWEKVRTAADQQLKKTSSADRVAILTFDRQPRALVSLAEWSAWPVDQRAALARQRLATVSPGWMGTHLGLALAAAAEQFSDVAVNGAPAGRRELVVVTDLQEGAKLDGLQGFEWPAGVGVDIERVGAPKRSNAGLQVANQAGDTAGTETGPRVRVVNAADSRAERFRFGWSVDGRAGFVDGSVEAYVPPGQSRTFTAPKPSTGMAVSQLRLTGDDEDFDNVAYYVAPEVEHVTVLYFGMEAANDSTKPRYYLQRAFPETPRRQVQVIPPPIDPARLPESLAQAAIVVIPGKLSPEQAALVRDRASRGGTALLVLTDVDTGPTLAALAGWPEIQLAEAGGDYALLGEIDFTHSLFAPFADPRYSDFARIHFWKHRRWEIPAGANVRILARFDDGAPALAQLPIGTGSLLVLASGWDPADSQLALSTKFVPLLQALLDWSGAGAPPRTPFQTGDSIPSPVSPGGAAVQWRKPDGGETTLPAGDAFAQTDVPGIYVAIAGGKTRRFAVNLPLEESRTAPLALDELARLGVPLRTSTEPFISQVRERQRHLQHEALETHQKLWRWLILTVLTVAFVEITVGGWLARRRETVESSP
jgi:hypothetical protein